MEINIKFGVGNSLTREFPDGTTVGQVLSNTNVQAGLGFGANVQAIDEDGRVLSNSYQLEDGKGITVETKANTKAARR